MKHTTTLAILLATASLAAAEPTPQSKPEPTDTKLAQLVGRWEGTTTFTLRGQTTKGKMSTSCERATVSPAIICTSVGVSGEMRLEEVWMFGYDRASDTYHLFMTNNWGEAYDHAGKWSDAAQVPFVHTGTRDGKPLREEYALAFKGNALTFHGTISLDGKVFGEGTTSLARVR